MKAKNKYLVFVAGAFIALSACQQDESLTQRPQGDASVITFNSPYTIDSRSDAMRSGSFEKGDKVGVLGYCIAKNSQGVDYSTSPWDTKKPFCTPDVFYNKELTYSGTGSWNYTWGSNEATGDWSNYEPVGSLHPWATNEKYTYSFFAYYPYAELTQQSNGTWEGTIDGGDLTDDRNGLGTITLSGKEESGDPTITYTMPHHYANSTSTLDWWVVPDFMLAYKTNHLKRDGSVKLDFRHLFCSFEFVINNYNTKAVTVEDFYVHGGTTVGGDKNGDALTGFYQSLSVTGQQSDYSVGNDIYIGRFKLVGRTEDREDEHVLASFTCGGATEDANGNIIPETKYITYPPESENSEDAISLLFIPDHLGKLTSGGNDDIRISLTVTQDGQKLFDADERSMNLKDISFAPGVRSIFNINIIGNDFYIQMRSDGSWSDGGDSDIVFE